MADYVFISSKMNLQSDWWCFLAVSSQGFVVFTFHILLLNRKSKLRNQKDLKLIYWCTSLAIEIWLVM